MEDVGVALEAVFKSLSGEEPGSIGISQTKGINQKVGMDLVCTVRVVGVFPDSRFRDSHVQTFWLLRQCHVLWIGFVWHTESSDVQDVCMRLCFMGLITRYASTCKACCSICRPCICVCIHTYIHTYIHTNHMYFSYQDIDVDTTYPHMYIYTYIHMYTCISVCMRQRHRHVSC